MPYTLKQATIHPTTPTISLVMADVPVPPFPEDGLGASLSPMWLAGNRNTISLGELSVANFPGAGLWAGVYRDSATLALEGIKVFGVGDHDYAIRSAGLDTGSANAGGAYINETFFGIVTSQESGLSQYSYDTLVQNLGDFSGGEHAAASLVGTVNTVIDYTENFFDYGRFVYFATSLNSTPSSPECLFMFTFNRTETAGAGTAGTETVGALRCGTDGVLSLVGLFKADDAAYNESVFPITTIQASAQHHIISYLQAHIDDPAPSLKADGSLNAVVLTHCDEQAWPPSAWTTVELGLNDAAYPVYFNRIWTSAEQIGGGDLRVKFYPHQIIGCSLGFIFSFAEWIPANAQWEPKFLLFDKDWDNFQNISITGDATTDTILAQGTFTVPTTQVRIALTYDDATGLYSLLGGTESQPLVVQTGEPSEPGGGVVDEDIRLRVWPFSLDGHDYFVLRVGATETLVYDLTTGQWAHWASPDEDVWTAHVGQNWVGMSAATFANGFGTDVVAGDDEHGVLYVLDPTAGQDDNPVDGQPQPFDRMVMGGIPLDGREVAKCSAVTLNLSLGSPALTGADITLETSDDMGQSWADHGAVTVAAADYSAVVEWRSLGLMRAPGRVFRITDNGAAVRISAADLR